MFTPFNTDASSFDVIGLELFIQPSQNLKLNKARQKERQDNAMLHEAVISFSTFRQWIPGLPGRPTRLLLRARRKSKVSGQP